jgi:hypothetical protein
MTGSKAIAAAFFGLLLTGTATAAGPYDGTWESQCTSEGRCRGDLQVTVTGNQFSGKFTAVGYDAPVSGTIAADGTFDGSVVGKNGTGKVNGQFSPNSSTLIFPQTTCGIPMTCPLSRTK